MKRYKVKHYFVLARIVKKDGSLSKSFVSKDFFDRESAECYLKSCKEQGTDELGRKTLPFQLIEYEAMQSKEKVYNKQYILVEGEEFNTMYVPPKAVCDTYNKNAGLDQGGIKWKIKNKGGRPRGEPTYVFSIRVSKPMKEFLSKPDNKGKINKFIKELVEKSDSYKEFLKTELNNIFSKQTKHCNNLEDELNRLWIARCKINNEFIDFIARLQEKGYTFKFSDKIDKQLELVKIENKDLK